MRGRLGTRWFCAAAVAAVLSGCDDTIAEPNLRFGQSGQLVVEVRAPQRGLLGDGELRQTLTWRSTGAWQLLEGISYRGESGGEATTRSPGIPVAFASAYATFIALISSPGLDLFINELDPNLDLVCNDDQTRVTLWIQDEIRRRDRRWTRCSRGTLGSLNPSEPQPGTVDVHASRVIIASNFIYTRTLGDSASSAFRGSIPFATLDKGAKPGELRLDPRAFFGGPGAGDEPADWRDFWEWHAGPAPPPYIDWSTDMVVFAGGGPRYEAGNTIEIRKIEPALDRTFVRLVELVPGDFCSPAAVVQTPFHMVVAPRTPTHVHFADLTEERVPCGL